MTSENEVLLNAEKQREHHWKIKETWGSRSDEELRQHINELLDVIGSPETKSLELALAKFEAAECAKMLLARPSRN